MHECVEEITSNPNFCEECMKYCKDENLRSLVYWLVVLKEEKPVLALQSIMKKSSSILAGGDEKEFEKFSEKIDLDGIIYNFCILSRKLPNPTKSAVEKYTYRELLRKSQEVVMKASPFIGYSDRDVIYPCVGFSLADRAGWDEYARMKTLKMLDLDLKARNKKDEILRRKVEVNIELGTQKIARRDVFSPAAAAKPENIKFQINFFDGLMHEMDGYYQKYTSKFETACTNNLMNKLEEKINVLALVIEKFQKYKVGFVNERLAQIVEFGGSRFYARKPGGRVLRKKSSSVTKDFMF